MAASVSERPLAPAQRRAQLPSNRPPTSADHAGEAAVPTIAVGARAWRARWVHTPLHQPRSHRSLRWGSRPVVHLSPDAPTHWIEQPCDVDSIILPRTTPSGEMCSGHVQSMTPHGHRWPCREAQNPPEVGGGERWRGEGGRPMLLGLAAGDRHHVVRTSPLDGLVRGQLPLTRHDLGDRGPVHHLLDNGRVPCEEVIGQRTRSRCVAGVRRGRRAIEPRPGTRVGVPGRRMVAPGHRLVVNGPSPVHQRIASDGGGALGPGPLVRGPGSLGSAPQGQTDIRKSRRYHTSGDAVTPCPLI